VRDALLTFVEKSLDSQKKIRKMEKKLMSIELSKV